MIFLSMSGMFLTFRLAIGNSLSAYQVIVKVLAKHKQIVPNQMIVSY